MKSGNKRPSSRTRKTKKHSAPKAIFSFKRHILPPLAGLLVMLAIFIGLNGQVIEAQLRYRMLKPQATVLAAPNPNVTKTPDPSAPSSLSIPSLDIEAPIIFEPSNQEWAIQTALRSGVDHYGNTANPGQPGNTVIFGHSSGQLWAPGDYKFVFTLLNKINSNDQITIDYQGTHYIYKVTSTETILPSNLSVLSQNSAKPSLTLITCTPVGTDKYRFVVHATQISPAVTNTAEIAQPSSVAKAQPELPGSAHSSIWKSLISWL